MENDEKGNRNVLLLYMNIIIILLVIILVMTIIHTEGEGDTNYYYTTNNNDNSTHISTNQYLPPNVSSQHPDPITYVIMYLDDFNITSGTFDISAQIHNTGELTIVYVFVNVTSVDEPINETENNSTYMIRGKGTSTDGRYNLIIRELETEPEDDLYYCNQSTYNASYLGEILSQQEFDEMVEEHDRLVAEVMAEREQYSG